MPIVVVDEAREEVGAQRGVLVGFGIGPLPEGSLDEALGFAVGLRAVRASADVSDAKGTEIGGKEFGLIAGAVVAHEALSFNAQRGKVGQGSLEEDDGALGAFIGHDLCKSDAGGVVDGDMDELPSSAADVVAGVFSDAMAWTQDAAEFFDVSVDEFA